MFRPSICGDLDGEDRTLMSFEIIALLSAFVAVTLWYVWRWIVIERQRHRADPSAPSVRPRPVDGVIGFVTNFFDTLGIGSFAPTTAIFKLLRRMPDERI